MNFGEAMEIVKYGGRVSRHGWNGAGMFVFLASVSTNRLCTLGRQPIEGRDVMPFLCMLNARGEIQPGWLASQADMLAEDWQELSARGVDYMIPQPASI